MMDKSFKILFTVAFLLSACASGAQYTLLPGTDLPGQEASAVAETETPDPGPLVEPISSPESVAIPDDVIHCSFANMTDPVNHPCSVAQLKSILGFDVKEPALDDPRLVFIKAYWNGPTSDVTQADLGGLFYECPNSECNLLITQVPLVTVDKSNIVDWGKIPSSAVESVNLQEGTGRYVKGWFFQAEPGQPKVWSPDLETQRLAWVRDDVLFTIALDGNSSVESIGKTDLIEIANRME